MEENLDFNSLFTEEEWELLCDRCGICCLYKIEDYDTGEYLFTRIACPFLDTENGNCKTYLDRFDKMPTCARIAPTALEAARLWMPKHCAYRCLFEQRPLPSWHPLFRERNKPVIMELLTKISSVTNPDNTIPIITENEIHILRMNAKQVNSKKKLDRQLIDNVITEFEI